MKNSSERRVAKLVARYKRLANSLAGIGPICQGTIMRRVIIRQAPGTPKRAKRYGPYYQWTRKIHGKTVNINLAKAQSKAYAAAIRNHRRLERTLQQMRDISLQILDLTTTGVPRRKRSK